MDIYRIDTENGDYYTLTEKELNEQFTVEEIEEFKNDDTTFFYKTNYTVRQLNRARKLHGNEDYCYSFEEEYSIAPSVYDILKHLYQYE